MWKRRIDCRAAQFEESLDADTLIERCKDLGPELIARFVERLGRALRVDPSQKRVLLNWDKLGRWLLTE